jgi:hypothetical protein
MNKNQFKIWYRNLRVKRRNGTITFFDYILSGTEYLAPLFDKDPLTERWDSLKRGHNTLTNFTMDSEWNSVKQYNLLSVKQIKRGAK